MSLNLPNGHLSPSAVAAYLRCPKQFEIFRIRKHLAPPEIALEVGKESHATILDNDLAGRLAGRGNMPDEELLEHYLEALGRNDALLSAPTLDEEGGIGGLIDSERSLFARHVKASRPWRESVPLVGVEYALEGEFFGIPISARIDILGPDSVTDLKRRRLNKAGRKQPSYTADEVGTSLQLIPYALMTGRSKGSFVSMCDASPGKPVEFSPVEAPITVPQAERAGAIYNDVAERISAGYFPPVDTSGSAGWACQARFCGAWRKDATDFVTGTNIACAFGQKSAVSV